MSSVCFVCNLPILSHQVGLIWQGGNGWDDLVREQVEESTLRQRLGTGRRDSAAQITSISPPAESQETSPPSSTRSARRRRRRSSLAQLTDKLREWGGSSSRSSSKSSKPSELSRRETLADLARNLPWGRSSASEGSDKKRRDSTADPSKKSSKTKGRDSSSPSTISELRSDFARLWGSKRVSTVDGSGDSRKKNRDDSVKGHIRKDSTATPSKYGRSRRDSAIVTSVTPPPKFQREHTCHHHRRRGSRSVPGHSAASAGTNTERIRDDLRRSTSSTASDSGPQTVEAAHQPIPRTSVLTSTSAVPPLFPITSSAPLPSSIEKQSAAEAVSRVGRVSSASGVPAKQDSTTQVYSDDCRETVPKSPDRRTSRRSSRLTRQGTAIDESVLPSTRRESQPALSPDPDDGKMKPPRRDSLSPDSASFARTRQDSRARLSPERGERELSPGARRGGYKGIGLSSRHHESSSCSSRDTSPSTRPTPSPPSAHMPVIRRQSTTEEILIARGFRRQSTTEEMIRCRNFRRQSSRSEDGARSKGRRDSCAQITDGTFATMTVETSSTFFDTSTQTEPSALYDNNYYHEECLKCNSCGLNLTGPNMKRARRFKNQILCDLHFADVALMETSDFMQQLRSFKPQSLGCAVARRKSSTTMIFPLPPQACTDELCGGYPHNLIPTPGYWIECSKQKIKKTMTSDESTSTQEEEEEATDSASPPDKPEEREDLGGVIRKTRPQVKEPCLLEYDEDHPPAQRKKTTIQEQWERNQGFELTSVEQETYEKYFYGTEHWNYFTNDEDLGPVILSIKQETINSRDQFRILVRAISYTAHGLIPASCVFADRYNREEVVLSLGKEININPPLTLGQLPDTPEELLKLDQVFIKSELKVGVIYVKEGQSTEEEILNNTDTSPRFQEFLTILGDRVVLKGFDKYKGGLDTVHDLTGLESIYTNWRNIEIMFHVATLLPHEPHDPQKLQRKRHIGNDIVCVVFLDAEKTCFSPSCIKSHFLHTFILVRPLPKKRRIRRYEVSVVTRDEVGAYKPYLWEQNVFSKGPMFREWLLTKIVNGERASYSAPKFARMQERTRSQILEDIVANLANHAETGQIPKPYRRGSWRPIGHMRPSSPLLDSVRDDFEDHDVLAKDFTKVFLNTESNIAVNRNLFDVTFLVGQSKEKTKLYGVRAILAVRSRVFQEMLYGIQTGFGSPQVPVAEILARAVPTLHSPQKQRSSNYLQVPDIEAPRSKSVPSSPMMKRAFSRLGNITAGWGRSNKKSQPQLTVEDRKKWASSQDCSNKEAKDKERDKPSTSSQLPVPKLSVCADTQKVDRSKLAQTEFVIIEFDPETFRNLLDYLHTGSCKISCKRIPGMICAAEHYDLPDLLQACFHHAKQFLKIEFVCDMLNTLENYYWRYTSASELVNMIMAFIETRAHQLFQAPGFIHLSESMVQMIMGRNLEIPEVRKFEAMLAWAKNKVKSKESSKADAKAEFRSIMDRLTKDIKLYRITPQELIKVVLPTKAIKNESILETLMYQANSGMYRIQDSYIIECQEKLEQQKTRVSEGESDDEI